MTGIVEHLGNDPVATTRGSDFVVNRLGCDLSSLRNVGDLRSASKSDNTNHRKVGKGRGVNRTRSFPNSRLASSD
jgi:hypothetical protein